MITRLKNLVASALQRAGIIDNGSHTEPDTCDIRAEVDEQWRLLRADLSRKIRRTGIAACAAITLSLTGCGGGDDDEPGTGPNVDESTYVRCDNGRTAYSIEECRGMPTLPPAPASAARQ